MMSNRQNPGIYVECLADYCAEQEPGRFFYGDRQIMVREILDRWLDPSHGYFKLRGDDDALYILRHDIILDSWELILFDSGKYEPTRLSST
jgi:hypothetical protein